MSYCLPYLNECIGTNMILFSNWCNFQSCLNFIEVNKNIIDRKSEPLRLLEVRFWLISFTD